MFLCLRQQAQPQLHCAALTHRENPKIPAISPPSELSHRTRTSSPLRPAMSKVDPARIASHLEQLPLELHEAILVNLSFRDVIALAKYAPENSRIEAALTTSPTWRDIWPTYLHYKDDFQTLVSLIVPVGGGRLFDPTRGALDVTPKEFNRRLQRLQAIHGDGYDFFKYTEKAASDRIQGLLGLVDPVNVLALCRTLSLDQIAAIIPWLKIGQKDPKTDGTTRQRQIDQLRNLFFHTLTGYCKCQTTGPYPYVLRKLNKIDTASCDLKHPGLPTPNWTVAQMRAFVDAYSAFQRQLNTTKEQQLRTLGRLYRQHHTRLKEPMAPQDVRFNVEHIPHQLDTVAGFVSRIIDLDQGAQPGTKQGKSRFRYRHPCLIPYDWCLQLWFRVTEANPRLLGGGAKQSPPLEESMKELSVAEHPQPSAQILQHIQTVEEGLRTYYMYAKGKGKEKTQCEHQRLEPYYGELPRPRTRMGTDFADDPSKTVFAVHHEVALERGGKKVLLPPIHADEMKWLVAFVRVVEWMEREYPELAAEEKEEWQG